MTEWTVIAERGRQSCSVQATAPASDAVLVELPGMYRCVVTVDSGGGTARLKASITSDINAAVLVAEVTGQQMVDVPGAVLLRLEADVDFDAGMAVGWVKEAPIGGEYDR